MTVSNELQPKEFVSRRDIEMQSWTASPVLPRSFTSRELKFEVHKPAKTAGAGKPNTLTVLPLPSGTELEGWRLKAMLLISVRLTRKEALATTCLEGITEYGTAKGESEAIKDLVVSLGEYRESLERREESLGDSARHELAYLRGLVERVTK